MDTCTVTTPQRPMRARRRIGLAVVAVVATTTFLSSCASVAFVVPQAVVWVPGHYTFAIPAGAPETMGPGGQVVVCSSTTSVLYIQVSEPGQVLLSWTPTGGSTGDVTLFGAMSDGWLNAPPSFAYTDGPLQPGCGTLQYAAHAGDPFPYAGPSTVTVWITTSAPTP